MAVTIPIYESDLKHNWEALGTKEATLARQCKLCALSYHIKNRHRAWALS